MVPIAAALLPKHLLSSCQELGWSCSYGTKFRIPILGRCERRGPPSRHHLGQNGLFGMVWWGGENRNSVITYANIRYDKYVLKETTHVYPLWTCELFSFLGQKFLGQLFFEFMLTDAHPILHHQTPGKHHLKPNLGFAHGSPQLMICTL